MTTLVQYAVRYDDTLQSIAAAELGDAARWTDIVAINSLRRPYISASLPDQLGPLQGQYALQSSLAQGATQITGWNTGAAGYGSSAALLVAGAVLVLTSPQADGTLLYDAAQISSVSQTLDPSTGASALTITLLPLTAYSSLSKRMTLGVGGLQRAHSAGETLQVYRNPLVLTTAVARPGDLISLPQASLDQSGQVQPGTLDALGTDALLDQNGQKQVGPDGDVATVSGVDNVAQALRSRINTTPGDLPQHPEYGCEIQFYVGAAQESYWPDLATALIHDCVLQDARVQDVTNMQFQQVGDTDYIDLQVVVNNGGQVLSASVPVPQ